MIKSEERRANFNFDDKVSIALAQNEKQGGKSVRPVYRVQFPDGFVKRFSEGQILIQLQASFDAKYVFSAVSAPEVTLVKSDSAPNEIQNKTKEPAQEAEEDDEDSEDEVEMP